MMKHRSIKHLTRAVLIAVLAAALFVLAGCQSPLDPPGKASGGNGGGECDDQHRQRRDPDPLA